MFSKKIMLSTQNLFFAVIVTVAVIVATTSSFTNALVEHNNNKKKFNKIASNDYCSGLQPWDCFNASGCSACPLGFGSIVCQNSSIPCACSGAAALSDICNLMPNCVTCPVGYQGSSCHEKGFRCPCGPMMESQCAQYEHCRFYPAGAEGGGQCVEKSKAINPAQICSVMTQNECIAFSDICLWCGTAAMAGSCYPRNGTRCPCSQYTQNECAAAQLAGSCRFCAVQNHPGQGTCKEFTSSC